MSGSDTRDIRGCRDRRNNWGKDIRDHNSEVDGPDRHGTQQDMKQRECNNVTMYLDNVLLYTEALFLFAQLLAQIIPIIEETRAESFRTPDSTQWVRTVPVPADGDGRRRALITKLFSA